MPKYIVGCLLLLIAGRLFAQKSSYQLAFTRLEIEPYGDMVFANKVFSQDYFSNGQTVLPDNSRNILGTPKAIKTADSFFNLMKGKSIVLSFANFPIRNSNGGDIFIFCEEFPDNLLAYISEDGKNWLELGAVHSKKKHINISSKPNPSTVYRYLKLKNYSKVKGRSELQIDAVALRLPPGAKRYYPITEDTIMLRDENPIIRTRDFRKADGDHVMLYLDNEKVTDIYLSKWYSKINLELEPGPHEIYIQALNTGKIFPNTFSLEIVDDDKVYFKEMRLEKGKGIRINLMRPKMDFAGSNF